MSEPRKMFKRISDLRSIKIRELIEVKRVIGEGTDEDPARMVIEIYEKDGKLIARSDPH